MNGYQYRPAHVTCHWDLEQELQADCVGQLGRIMNRNSKLIQCKQQFLSLASCTVLLVHLSMTWIAQEEEHSGAGLGRRIQQASKTFWVVGSFKSI